MSNERSGPGDARRKANSLFSKATEKEEAAERERRKAELALEEKTARLRSLRLAKEAADREAAAARKAAGRARTAKS